ncbi:sensor histidine kinase [Paenibacillus sp. YN15]|uniref:cache domain-containing sensor histidine kinase n=1 Tax=Paenibacillus sp. YN15 TaxID=1742774 RepID=UPI000DCE089D|nr:sensor histidine kinase [Paenibacillus sp. YN15]RAU95338.1 sensor histidine kinase [Paenibacillus sp. YN15]
MKKIYPFSDWRLTTKVIVIFLVLVILPVSLFGWALLRNTNAIMQAEAIDTTVRIVDTAQKNMTSVIREVEDISSYIIFSSDFRQMLKISSTIDMADGEVSEGGSVEQVTGFLTFQLMSKSYISSILLEGRQNTVLDMGEPIVGIREKEWSAAAYKRAGAIYWTPSYTVRSQWNGGERHVISLFRQINDLNQISMRLGEVRIRLKEDQIYQLISGGISPSLGSMFILGKDGSVIVHENKDWLGRRYPDEAFIQRVLADGRNQTRFGYVLNGRSVAVVSQFIEGTDWNMVAVLDQAAIMENLKGMQSYLVLMIGLVLALGIAASFGFYWAIIRPVTDLIRETRRVEKGDFTAQVQVRSRDEIGLLGNRFNRMVLQIQRLIETKFMLEIKQKESDLKSLQAQIDPHFLYNTLDMIRWTARLEQAMKTSRLIEALSHFFRMGLSGGRIWVTVGEELAYVASYLELQQERLGGQLKSFIEVEEGLDRQNVLKQILQPLVENSIVHGYPGGRHTLSITIRCYREDEHIVMDVIDDGKGFGEAFSSENFREKLLDDGGYALRNIHERLRLAYGEGCGPELMPAAAGAWIRVKIPLHHEEPGEVDFNTGQSGG